MARHSSENSDQRHGETGRDWSREHPAVINTDPASIKVQPVHGTVEVAEVRHRFGGVDAFAVLAGALTALGVLTVLAAVAALVGRLGFADRAERDLVLAALITGLVALLLAIIVGGYVTGRVARYAGKRNGLLTGLLLTLLVAGGCATALVFDEVRDLELPGWLDGHLGSISIITAAAAVLVVLLVATAAGAAGARWHSRVDSLLLHTRPGALGYPAHLATPTTDTPTANPPYTAGSTENDSSTADLHPSLNGREPSIGTDINREQQTGTT